MNLARIVIPLVLGFIAGVLLTQQYCQYTETVTIYDSTIVTVTKPAPPPDTVLQPYYIQVAGQTKTVTEYETIPRVDTPAFVFNCLKTNVYKDTLVNDTDLFFYLKQPVYRNQIQGQTFSYKIRRPTVIKKPAVDNRSRVMVGAGAHFMPVFGAHFSAGYLRGRMLYRADVGKDYGAVGASFVF